MMNKKIISIISVAILIIAGSIWIYSANKFERMVQETILPKIKDYQDYINIDIEEVVIDKYKFKLTTGKISFFDDYNYSVEIDGTNFCYNPLTGTISITNIPNGKIAFHHKDLGIASKAKKITIKFDKELFKDNKLNSSIFINTTGIIQYLADSEEVLNSNEDAKISIEVSPSKKYKDNISIIASSSAIGTTIKNMKINSDDEILNRMMEQVGEIFKLKGDMDHEYKFEVDFNHNDFIKYLNIYELYTFGSTHKHMLNSVQKQELVDTLKEIKENEFLISAELYYKHANNDGYNVNYMIKNDGKRVIFDLDFDSHSAPNEEIDEKYTKMIVDFIYAIEQQESLIRGASLGFEAEDFKSMARMLADINKTKLSLKLNFDHKFMKISHELLVDINDHVFEFNGKKSVIAYKGNLKISKPEEFVNFVSGRLAESFKPIFISASPRGFAKEAETWYEAVVQNIKDNGFNAMKVFHNKDDLKGGEPLIADIKGDFNRYNFKINDKNFFQIMSDERLVLLFKNMPSDSTISKQNNGTNELHGQ